MKNHISFIYQNIHSFRSKQQSIHIDAIVEIMKSKDIYLYCVQETRLDGDYAKEIENYTMFNHYKKVKKCRRGQNGVAIFLPPTFMKFY